MPEFICKECGAREFHENEVTLEIQVNIHKKFCRQKPGEDYSFVHRDQWHVQANDPERENDTEGNPVIKK